MGNLIRWIGSNVFSSPSQTTLKGVMLVKKKKIKILGAARRSDSLIRDYNFSKPLTTK